MKPLVDLPVARGPWSEHLLEHLLHPPHDLAMPVAPRVSDPLVDDDLQLALYLCYELHYRGLVGVDDRWEWEPSLLRLCRVLEDGFEAALRAEVPIEGAGAVVRWALPEIIDGFDGPSLSSHILDDGTLAQLREFAVHRSAYQLKEADPHSWALPRLHGRPKAALVQIQSDEYGEGRAEDMHAQLFADTMVELGLDARYGAYVDQLPGVTLATTNVISMFGLHRRLRSALVGHLAVFEMTSVTPMDRYARALRRLGVGPAGRRFYDVHVEADAVHEVVALHELAVGLADQDPACGPDILFGARAAMAVEDRFARHLLDAWISGRTSLRGGALNAAA